MDVRGLYILKCVNCCKEFRSLYATRVYCSDKCKAEAFKKRRQQRAEIHMNKAERTAMVAKSAAKLADLNAKAKQAGMSYGEYKALIDGKIPRVKRTFVAAEPVKEKEV